MPARKPPRVVWVLCDKGGPDWSLGVYTDGAPRPGCGEFVARYELVSSNKPARRKPARKAGRKGR